MLRIALLSAALGLAACATKTVPPEPRMPIRSPADARALFQSTLVRLAGPGAIDCGVYVDSRNNSPGVACVKRALQEKHAFYFGDVHTYSDSGWYGFARDASGQESMIHVDAYEPEPNIYFCDEPLIVYGNAVMSCNPIDSI